MVLVMQSDRAVQQQRAGSVPKTMNKDFAVPLPKIQEETFAKQKRAVQTQDKPTMLPDANIQRIVNEVLSPNITMGKMARRDIQIRLSSFIEVMTEASAKKCTREKRASMTGDDVLWAASSTGFQDFDIPLRAYLESHRTLGDQNKRMRKGFKNEKSEVREPTVNRTLKETSHAARG